MAPQAEDAGKRKRVLVVGAGAAGMSCAHHLAQHPDKFDVTLIDTAAYCGGQAFSIPIDKDKHGASWLNQGVQGGSYIFHHTLTMFARQCFHADPVKLQVSFGQDDTFWTNVFPTRLIADHQDEVRRFVWMLKLVKVFGLLFALLPIKYLLALFRFPAHFAHAIALPMLALFLGTGNETPEVPSIFLERLCNSPAIGLWHPPDNRTVVSNMSPMVVFPNLSRFYDAWRAALQRASVTVRLSTELVQVIGRDRHGVAVRLARREPANDPHTASSLPPPAPDAFSDERFDELVLCTLADAAKRILGPAASWRERRVLGSARFADDITVTHCDAEYMRKHYETEYNESRAVSSLGGADQSARLRFAAQEPPSGFQPMYYIRLCPGDTRRVEMSFDCAHYQAQFPPIMPREQHVYQTIFLNAARDRHLWSRSAIADNKVIRADWWHQLCHAWTHYAFVVPWMWALQGRRHTRYAASWTLVNAHEVAVISGIAAAVDLGAEYPDDLERDSFAFLAFRLYYLLCYGRWYRKRATAKGSGREKGEGETWAGGKHGSAYCGPGVVKEERITWREEQEAGASL